MKRKQVMMRAFRHTVGGTVVAALATVLSAVAGGAMAQPSTASGGTLGPEACEPLRAAVSNAAELTAVSLDNLREYRRRLAALIAELEKDLGDMRAEERASGLERLRGLHQQVSELSAQEDEVRRQEERLANSRSAVDRLCPVNREGR